MGSALVREIERIARQRGLERLDLDASLTSEPFYAALGYEIRERGEHFLGSGQRMACVKMHKDLLPNSGSGKPEDAMALADWRSNRRIVSNLENYSLAFFATLE